ncbi:hypothetical protein [Marinobacter sp.]|uniref:hypothetical protein n=1 Tax=Marinobacter sp. TaxID=50741 RepID=UPI003A8F510A
MPRITGKQLHHGHVIHFCNEPWAYFVVFAKLIKGLLAVPGRWLGLFPTGVAAWMAVMVGFVGWVILRFSERYLRGDPGRGRFLPWFLLTTACVL